jgi:hypothetical protein
VATGDPPDMMARVPPKVLRVMKEAAIARRLLRSMVVLQLLPGPDCLDTNWNRALVAGYPEHGVERF